nr:MAG TPA: hypothetical protein [Bacteriophage sp.]
MTLITGFLKSRVIFYIHVRIILNRHLIIHLNIYLFF